MTVKEAQELVEVWNSRRGVRQSDLAGVAALSEKIGELARSVAQKQAAPHGKATAPAEELADIFWETLSFAVHSGVDLSDSLVDLLEKKNRTK